MKIEYEPGLKRGFLFVCTGNVFRSKTAAALACNKGLSCASAGFEPWRLQDEHKDMSYFNHGSNKDIVMDSRYQRKSTLFFPTIKCFYTFICSQKFFQDLQKKFCLVLYIFLYICNQN